MERNLPYCGDVSSPHRPYPANIVIIVEINLGIKNPVGYDPSENGKPTKKREKNTANKSFWDPFLHIMYYKEQTNVYIRSKTAKNPCFHAQEP